MDRASDGIRFDGTPGLPPGFDPSGSEPLDRPTAIAALRGADELLAANEPEQALALYNRVAGTADRDVVAAATYGAGNVLYRLDRDAEAVSAWERVVTMGETPATYRAWRQIAAARVRAGDLPGALAAYRECEKRAPAADKPEIHSRLGWLSKETGNAGAARRYFARSRGDVLGPVMTYLIIAVTVVTSLAAMGGQMLCGQAVFGGGPLEVQLWLDRILVAQGEAYRLLSVMLVHDASSAVPLHLIFNMYALWYAGQLVERMYGPWRLLAAYVITGLCASMASYVFGPAAPSVGASGAIFGLFGIALVATRYHAVADAQVRAIASQIGGLIVLNLFLGFSGIFGNIDNTAHVGGLLSGLWLAFLIPPTNVPTLSSFWLRRRGESRVLARALPIVGVLALVPVLAVGYVAGTQEWQNAHDPYAPCRVLPRTAIAPSSGPDLTVIAQSR
jgi:membrane associated rhomboid family serine protease